MSKFMVFFSRLEWAEAIVRCRVPLQCYWPMQKLFHIAFQVFYLLLCSLTEATAVDRQCCTVVGQCNNKSF